MSCLLLTSRSAKSYDHRLRNLVYQSQDISIALDLGVPRSTAHGWLHNKPQNVVTHDVFNLDEQQLQHEAIKLQKRCKRLISVIRLLVVLIRTVGISIDFNRFPDGNKKTKLLHAIDKAKPHLTLKSILRILGITSSRYHLWEKAQDCNKLDDQNSCPKTFPNQLTAKEIHEIKDMATFEEYRHIPTSTLATLAQRLNRVFASAGTWQKLIRERGWRRPRKRIHPAKPKIGIRSTKPDERWHIDTTIIRLLDGTKAYLHATIDNYSRRILAWHVCDHMDVMSTVTILIKASKNSLSPDSIHSFICDSGSENINANVDNLLRKGILNRILAYTDISFSNSMIEAWWRSLKHQWLFMNTLDNITTLRRLVSFYVNAHNTELPHSAFQGQTPDEMYFGKGENIAQQLKEKRKAARLARIEANRLVSCESYLN